VCGNVSRSGRGPVPVLGGLIQSKCAKSYDFVQKLFFALKQMFLRKNAKSAQNSTFLRKYVMSSITKLRLHGVLWSAGIREEIKV